MSMNYNPELLRLLTDERLREAEAAGRERSLRGDPRLADRTSKTASIIQILARRQNRPAPCDPVAGTC
jgi:hypothetical protein